jgi:hypothetical protein
VAAAAVMRGGMPGCCSPVHSCPSVGRSHTFLRDVLVGVGLV